MSQAGRNLQVGDEAYTNFNGGWKWVRITQRLENTGSQSNICFRTFPPVEQYAEPSARYDADWFEPAPKDAA